MALVEITLTLSDLTGILFINVGLKLQLARHEIVSILLVNAKLLNITTKCSPLLYSRLSTKIYQYVRPLILTFIKSLLFHSSYSFVFCTACLITTFLNTVNLSFTFVYSLIVNLYLYAACTLFSNLFLVHLFNISNFYIMFPLFIFSSV